MVSSNNSTRTLRANSATRPSLMQTGISILRRGAGAVTLHKATRAVSTIMGRFGKVMQGTHRRCKEGGRKAEMGVMKNEFKLIEGCMKFGAV